MKPLNKKLSKDMNRRAAEIVGLSVEEIEPINTVSRYLAKIGRKGGLKGGKARAARLSDEQKSKIASNAANQRWHPNKK